MNTLIRRTGVLVLSACILAATMAVAQTQDISIRDLAGKDAPAGAIWLDSLDLSSATTAKGKIAAGKSIGGKPLTLAKQVFEHGVGVYGESVIGVELKKTATRFVAAVGLDDETGGNGLVDFQVWVDGVKKADSGLMRSENKSKLLSVDLTGADTMTLVVPDISDINTADWAGAAIFATGNAIKVIPADYQPSPLPKIASCDTSKPSINGPRVVGTTPNKPFVFLVPASGEKLRSYSAKGLPAGLKLDAVTGIITGSVAKAGTYEVMLSVKGIGGKASRKLVIEAGTHKLALTPPMGWNSWNCWGEAVDEAKVRAAADAMATNGLAAHGFQYINIDDRWMLDWYMKEARDANGEIVPNKVRFPDMKALADYVHGKGLRLGIYSSPSSRTCASGRGSFQHEEQDALTYARWGIDYLKYDWCNYASVDVKDVKTVDDHKKPYRIMGKALDACSRDIVYSLCQYGMMDVGSWGAEVGGNLWRTSGDIWDTWRRMEQLGFDQCGKAKDAGPGHWNDPDMLIVGLVGWGPQLRKTKLKYAEQITHLTQWSLLAAPLLIGCDMTRLDKFTFDLLTNDEVLDVDQDPLGKSAVQVSEKNGIKVWSRPLWDGTKAVGIFNTTLDDAEGTVKWSDISVQGSQPVRDLWYKKDLGAFDGQYTVKIPTHGAVMLKVGTPRG